MKPNTLNKTDNSIKTKEGAPKKHVLWSKNQVQALEGFIENNMPISKIAKSLNKTTKAIRRKCERLGISSSTTYTKK